VAGGRTTVFFEARRRHHVGTVPDAESESYVRAVLERIRELAGGSVRPDTHNAITRVRRFFVRRRPST